MRREKKDALLIGEIWEDSNVWLMGDQFDSTMNYSFLELCLEFFAKKKLTLHQFDEKVNCMLFRYPLDIDLVQMNFLDTHDVPRFLSACDGNLSVYRAAVFFLMTCVGVPSIFYGDEKGIMGQTEESYRASMPWKKKTSLEQFFAECIAIRKRYKVLQEVFVVFSVSELKREVQIPTEYKGRLYDGRAEQIITGESIILDAMQGVVFEVKK